MAEVVKLELVEVGGGYRFDADEVLEAAKGQRFSRFVILGETEDGEIWVSGNANSGETLVLMERAKRRICFADD